MCSGKRVGMERGVESTDGDIGDAVHEGLESKASTTPELAAHISLGPSWARGYMRMSTTRILDAVIHSCCSVLSSASFCGTTYEHEHKYEYDCEDWNE